MVERSGKMFGWGNGCLPPIAPLTIPGIYSDTLSYEDNLAQIMKKINELIEQVNNLSNGVNNYTDEQISKLRNDINKEISALEKTLYSFVSDFEKEISIIEKETDTKLKDIRGYIDNEILKTNEKIKELKTYIDTQIFNAEKRQIKYTDNKVGVESVERQAQGEFLNGKIEKIVKDFPKVYNAVLGVKSDVQETFNSFYTYLRELGILSISYDKMEMTAEEYDKLELEAHVFDVYSGFIFSESLNKIFSPFTGSKENTEKVLYDLISHIRWNADTASYFDVHATTVKDYETAQIKAGTYEVDNIRGFAHSNNYLQRKYENTAVVWVKDNDDTTQGWFNSGWSSFTNKNDAEIKSFTLVFGRNGKKEEKTILYDIETGKKISFDLTDFSVTNEKQVAYTRLVTIGYHDGTNTDVPLNTFNIGDCVANSLSYEGLSHETYVANDNLVVYELRVNYTSGSYIEL